MAPIVSSVPVILSSEEEEEEEQAEEVAPMKTSSEAPIPGSESMYYTPNTTMEKLSEVAEQGKKEKK